MKHLFFLVLLSFLALLPGITGVSAQNIPIGHWRHHLPQNRIIGLTETPDRIIGATEYGLVVLNKKDQSLEVVNKVHGLSDTGISSIGFSSEFNLVIIGYNNGNIDIIRNNDEFLNIPDIRRASFPGSKSINSILVNNNRAYLSCGFGIVELDLTNFLIRDTYFIGPYGSQIIVNDLILTSEYFYAATNAGLLRADALGSNLADFQNWTRLTVSGNANEEFNLLAEHNGIVFANRALSQTDVLHYLTDQGWQVFSPDGENYTGKRFNLISDSGRLLISNPSWLDIFDQNLNLTERIDTYHEGSVRALDAMYDSNDQLWIGDHYYGLIRQVSSNNYQKLILSGPPTANSFGLASSGEYTWLVPGAISSGGGNAWNVDGIFRFDGFRWRAFDRFQFPQMASMVDIISIVSHPGNPHRLIAASWGGGIIEVTPEGPGTVYDDSNSPLSRRFGVGDLIRIGGVAFDRNGNLWVVNSESETPLHAMKPDGQWVSFPNKGIIDNSQILGDIVIDRSNQKWVVLRRSSGIYVFRESNLDNSNDFDARRLTTQENNGGLPSNNVSSLGIDHDGYMWVGTDKGVAVYYAPGRALTGEPFNAQQIIVEQDGFAAILLGTETINSITVDGSNKKWFGTARSGAYLLSADGRETIFHFTAQNSPLPSNNILDIAVNDKTGEVFFATDRGTASFRGLATVAEATHTDVYAYPNPVRPHYHGYIAIKGLVRNAFVKITDIAGNLVYETIAEGGQAIWNGKDFNGRRPSTGVYLVFSTNDDGTETMVTKILFIN
jgi:hypothetical protein